MVGNRVKILRDELGLKQDELAKKLGVSPSAVGMYERDLREANDEIKLRMCELFNCSMDYLTGKSDIKNSQKIDINDMDIAFASGIKGLNKENQETLKNILDGLLAKQKIEDDNKKENK